MKNSQEIILLTIPKNTYNTGKSVSFPYINWVEFPHPEWQCSPQKPTKTTTPGTRIPRVLGQGCLWQSWNTIGIDIALTWSLEVKDRSLLLKSPYTLYTHRNQRTQAGLTSKPLPWGLAFVVTEEVMQASKGTTSSLLDLRPLNQREIRFGTGNLGLVQVMDLGRVPTNATLLNWHRP